MRFDPDYDLPHHTSTPTSREQRIYQRIKRTIPSEADQVLSDAKAKATARGLSPNPFNGKYSVKFRDGKIVLGKR
jgi:hypothetical protein